MTEFYIKVDDAKQVKVLRLDGASALLIGMGNRLQIFSGTAWPEGTPNIPIVQVDDVDNVRVCPKFSLGELCPVCKSRGEGYD